MDHERAPHPDRPSVTEQPWQPIETFALPVFDARHWYRSGERLLLSNGGSIFIGHYSYNSRGKGRWQSGGRICEPSHWAPLPALPRNDSSVTVPPENTDANPS